MSEDAPRFTIDKLAEIARNYKSERRETAAKLLTPSDFNLFMQYEASIDDELSPFALLPLNKSRMHAAHLLGVKKDNWHMSSEELQYALQEAKSRPWDLYEISTHSGFQEFSTGFALALRCIPVALDSAKVSGDTEQGNWLHFAPFGAWDNEQFTEFSDSFPNAQISKQAVYMWLLGMTQLIEAVDKEDLHLTNPPIISGRTNVHHADFLKNWGFSITDTGPEDDDSRRYEFNISYSDLKTNIVASFAVPKTQVLLRFGQARYEDALANMPEYLNDKSFHGEQPDYFWPWYFSKRFPKT